MAALIRDVDDRDGSWIVRYHVVGGTNPSVTLRLSNSRRMRRLDAAIWLQLGRMGSYSVEEADDLAADLERAAIAVRAAKADASVFQEKRAILVAPGDDGG